MTESSGPRGRVNSSGPAIIKIETKGTSPIPRSGHRAVYHNGNLISFGGFNSLVEDRPELGSSPMLKELWSLNLYTRYWTKLKCKGRMQEQVASHTMVLQRNNLVVFGGTAIPFGSNCSNDVVVCSLDKMEWKVIPVKGKKPNKLYGQAARLTDEGLYIMGGTSGIDYSNDINRLDIRTGEWELLWSNEDNFVKTTFARPRYRHEIAVYNDMIWVIGGGTATSCYPLQLIPAFLIKTRQWTFVHTMRHEPYGHPVSRRCHAVVQDNEFVYVSGGFQSGNVLDDIWRLNMNTRTWQKLELTLPEPVFFHAMDMHRGYLYIFGGVLDKESDNRSNSVWKCRVQPPPLSELSWQCLNDHFRLDLMEPRLLLQIGVPPQYVKLIFQPTGS